ncbi:MAG: hypothetical protein K0U78_15035 [Actinomycetia bacterium]|nr:hypothetical protein [Actinomycetes bacterium]
MKYIVLEVDISENNTRLMPFMFSDLMNHDQFAESVQHNLLMNHKWKSVVSSAGFCNLFAQEINCCGESQTLNISSNPERDDRLFAMYNYEHGFIF